MSIKVMSIHLEKGGVGKTTISTQVAFELSKQGKNAIKRLRDLPPYPRFQPRSRLRYDSNQANV